MMKVNVFGDICLDGIDWQRFEFDPALRTLMDGAVNVGNLECPITPHELPKALQAGNLRAPPESVELLRGFAAVSLASNHVQDVTVQVAEPGYARRGIGGLPRKVITRA